MKSRVMDWTEWVLVPLAVLLLAACHRLELLAIVVPIAILAAYAVSRSFANDNSSQRKI